MNYRGGQTNGTVHKLHSRRRSNSKGALNLILVSLSHPSLVNIVAVVSIRLSNANLGKPPATLVGILIV